MYQFNAKELKSNVAKAYSTGGKFINQTGSYRLMIENSYWEQNDYGYKSLVLQVISEDEKTANLKLMYENDKGERAYGANHLDAMIVCAGLRNGLSTANGTAMIYSWVDRSMIETDVQTCPELNGKWFTLLLQEKKHAYIAKSGDRAGQVTEQNEITLSSVFQDKTNLSAVEIMDKVTVSADYDKFKAQLEANPVYETNNYKSLVKNGGGNQGAGSYGNSPQNTSNNNDLDDDLPF